MTCILYNIIHFHCPILSVVIQKSDSIALSLSWYRIGTSEVNIGILPDEGA